MQLTCHVFSAHAEVVPGNITLADILRGILRARGGSSLLDTLATLPRQYSPRTWR